MIRDITIGQYYPVDSVLHRLDPRVKLNIAFFYIVSLFLDKNPVLFAIAICVLVASFDQHQNSIREYSVQSFLMFLKLIVLVTV